MALERGEVVPLVAGVVDVQPDRVVVRSRGEDLAQQRRRVFDGIRRKVNAKTEDSFVGPC